MEAFVQMTGYVGADVNLRKASVPVADFRLASTPRVWRDGGWTDDPTTWITVKTFRTLAENVAFSLRRGDPVIVVGRLRTSTWERDGQTHERLELDAVTVGPDLRRGTSMFHKNARPARPEGEADGEPDGEVRGEIDPETGEIRTTDLGEEAELDREIATALAGAGS